MESLNGQALLKYLLLCNIFCYALNIEVHVL